MGATVFYQNSGGADIATLENVFKVGGTPTDPTAVSCIITDPAGNVTTHTYGGAAPADISKASTGDFTLLVPVTLTGLWGYLWVGTGTASDVQAGTFTGNPSATINQFYTSLEEVKDRLGVDQSDTSNDFQLLASVQSAARAIEMCCGRHFYPMTDTRTYVPYTLYELPLDDIISVTTFKVDRDGDGVFEETWASGTDYELAVAPYDYNPMATGEMRPYTIARVTNTGKMFPFWWEFSRLDRVQVAANFGWPQVPFGVREATMQTAAEIFKLKDSPFGLAGTSEFGMVRIPRQNPYIMKLLTAYVSPRRKVGV